MNGRKNCKMTIFSTWIMLSHLQIPRFRVLSQPSLIAQWKLKNVIRVTDRFIKIDQAWTSWTFFARRDLPVPSKRGFLFLYLCLFLCRQTATHKLQLQEEIWKRKLFWGLNSEEAKPLVSRSSFSCSLCKALKIGRWSHHDSPVAKA